jgi:hypothetical protein
MAKKNNRPKSANGADRKLAEVRSILQRYQAQHPSAKVDAKRYNSASIRVRVVDPAFEGVHRADRDKELWELIQELPDDTAADITMLVLLAPSELSSSMANLEFEHPSPSQL